MGKSSESSPFAALTSQERKERWICWQSQRYAVSGDSLEKQTEGDHGTGSVIQCAKQTESLERVKPHHSQYNAVLKRMDQARRRVGAYTNCDG